MKKLSLKAKVATGAAAVMGSMMLGATLFAAAPVKADTAIGSSAGQLTLAQAFGGAQRGTGAVGCTGYLDQDGDGICDRCGNTPRAGHHGCGGFVDADGDGTCDNCTASGGTRTGRGSGANYVDADGDGVCDNCGTTSCSGYGCSANGAGQGTGNGQGAGNGQGVGGHHHGQSNHHGRC